MKKLVLAALLCAAVSVLKAQYTQVVAGPSLLPITNYVYLGSLTRDPNDGGNCQKLKIDILGGGFFSNSVGATTFYIANRGGLSVSQVIMGSSGIPSGMLKAFQNGLNTDFYLFVNGGGTYTSFSVQSYLLEIGGQQYNTITTSTNTPAGTDISANLVVNPVMITDPSGNVGIGTPNIDPAYKLSVGGSIRAMEVKVETGWADYVFGKGYKLKPLSELNDYIRQNKHLPGVPSAAEVKENGVKVGETESLLLRKIEELTLYLIEMKKDDDILKQRIDSLERSNK